jgi:hypothetical protein
MMKQAREYTDTDIEDVAERSKRILLARHPETLELAKRYPEFIRNIARATWLAVREKLDEER